MENALTEEDVGYVDNVKIGSDPSLLIVEDDSILLHRLVVALSSRGFAVTAASSAAEACRLIQTSPPAFAVFDMKLGDGNGIDLMSSLRERRHDARAIILTGYGNLRTAVAAVTFGAFDYLAKPADADEIHNALMTPRHDRATSDYHPRSIDEVRMGHITATYKQFGGNLSETARRLSLHRRTLQRILARQKMP